ncbi:hypothetical protein ISCGN_007923 [Ixodes scapularis]
MKSEEEASEIDESSDKELLGKRKGGGILCTSDPGSTSQGSHCDCDRDFHGCLRGAKSNIADTIGNVYFNVIKVPCIRKVRKAVCTDRGRYSRNENNCEAWAYQELGMQFVPTEHHYE